jgi:hypothetical protein
MIFLGLLQKISHSDASQNLFRPGYSILSMSLFDGVHKKWELGQGGGGCTPAPLLLWGRCTLSPKC